MGRLEPCGTHFQDTDCGCLARAKKIHFSKGSAKQRHRLVTSDLSHPLIHTYLLAILAGKYPPNRGYIVDVLGSWGQQVAWDVILILLQLRGLIYVALPHSGGHHHLRTKN